MPVRVLHMIGNAHIDPVWLWRWQEGLQEARATFWSAIQRMDEYDDFVFTCDQVGLLEFVEESDPVLFEQIRKRVAEHRWVNVGGWWVEPDCNLPIGESFVRQGLYGQRYLHEKFGAKATVGLNADPFGHGATLPQILRKQGMEGYCFLRPGPHEAELPGNPFWWEAPDGSRVLAYRIPHEYCGPRADIAHHIDKAVAQLPTGLSEGMVFYGVGNHGGGPTKANIESIRRVADLGVYGELRLSSPPAYVAAVHRSGVELPVWRGELQHHAAGCYSAHSPIKRWVRSAEHGLLVAEKLSTVASHVAGTSYPRERLTEAWKLVLFNQFHDILPGTSIEPAYEDARDQLGAARSTAGRALDLAVQTIARDVDIPFRAGEQPVLVFNPHPWPVRTEVEREFPWAELSDVRDETGASVPAQFTQALATVSRPRRLVFPVELPPLGYRLYWIVPGATSPSASPPSARTVLENDRLRVEVDPATGWLRALVDKGSGRDLVQGSPRPHTVVSDDRTDTWGHRVVSYVKEGKPFRCRSVRLVEDGPVRSVLRIESTYGKSALVEELVLGRDAAHLEVHVTLDWHEQLKLTKLRFPTALREATATYEIPYGHLERAVDGGEEPGQSWVDVSGVLPDGTRAGLAVVNDAKSAYDVLDGEIGITMVRSPVYAWHEPRELEPEGTFSYHDQGRQSFRYLLVPHDGDWRSADVVRTAAELQQQPVATFESFHSGPLPPSRSFVSASDGSVVVTVLKVAEDGPEHVVLRAYESVGRPERLTVDLAFLGRTVEADFAPHEIKTLLVPVDPEQPVRDVDLLEYDDA